MLPGPQVLVKFKKGEQVVFEIQGHDDFVRLAQELARIWGAWLFIGPNAVVRRSDIAGIYYLKDGWNAQSSQSSMPQD